MPLQCPCCRSIMNLDDEEVFYKCSACSSKILHIKDKEKDKEKEKGPYDYELGHRH